MAKRFVGPVLCERMHMVDTRGCTGVASRIGSDHGQVNANRVPSRPSSASGGVGNENSQSELEGIMVG
jgi:hypothetical protein